MVKNPPAMQETGVWSLGKEYSLEKEMPPIPVLWPGKSHGQRSLVGYCLWGHMSNKLVTKPPLPKKKKNRRRKSPQTGEYILFLLGVMNNRWEERLITDEKKPTWEVGLYWGKAVIIFLQSGLVFLSGLKACRILVPWSGVEPRPPAVEKKSLNPNHQGSPKSGLILEKTL